MIINIRLKILKVSYIFLINIKNDLISFFFISRVILIKNVIIYENAFINRR